MAACDRRVIAYDHIVVGNQPQCSARGRAELLGLGLEQVDQAVLGELDAGREPEAAGPRHVTENAAQPERAARPSDDVGMHRERDVLRALRRALREQLVEVGLPGLEPVMWIAVLAVAVAEQRAVAERLPRQLNDDLAVLFVQERQLLVEAVGVEVEAVLEQERDRVGGMSERESVWRR